MTMRRRMLSVAALLLGLVALTGCDRLRREFNGGEILYDASVTVDEVNWLGEFLIEEGFFDGELKSIELVRRDGVIQFRMVVREGVDQNEEFLQLAKDFADQLSLDVFDNEKVVIHMCDKYLKTLRIADPDF